MAPRRPPAWLQPDEDVLMDAGRHPLSILDNILASTIAIGLLIAAGWFVATFWPPIRPYLLPFTLLLAALWVALLVSSYWRVVTSRYVITRERIYRAHGRVRFVLVQTTYDKVTDLHVHQSLFGRIWDFGTVSAQTAGTGLAMQGVRRPFEVKNRIESARRAFIDVLLREHGVRRAQEAVLPASPDDAEAPAWVDAPGTDQPLWRGGPVALTLLPATGSGAVMVVIGAMMAFGSLALAERDLMLLGIGVVLALAGISTFLQAWIQYRYTRYEVGPSGVVVTSGWLSRRRVETTFDKVTDVTTYQNFFARIFDYGNIRINTAGSNQAPVNFNGLARPENVKRIIDDARRRQAGRRR